MYVKFGIDIFAPSPFSIDILSPNEICYYNVVGAAGEKFSAFFWKIFYILSPLVEKYV